MRRRCRPRFRARTRSCTSPRRRIGRTSIRPRRMRRCVRSMPTFHPASRAPRRRQVHALRIRELGEGARRDLAPGRGLREDDPLVPSDAYGESKVAAEAALATVARDTGLRITALRLPLVYGPGCQGQLRRADPRGARRHGVAGRLDRQSPQPPCHGQLRLRDGSAPRRRGRGCAGTFTPYLLADAKPCPHPSSCARSPRRSVLRRASSRADRAVARGEGSPGWASGCRVCSIRWKWMPPRFARGLHGHRRSPSRPGSRPRCATPRRYNRSLRESRDSMPSRSGGRSANDLRPLRFTRGFTKHAEGSVLVEMGDTRVLCTASVEEGVPSFMKGRGEGWLTAEYGMLPRATHTRGRREAADGKRADARRRSSASSAAACARSPTSRRSASAPSRSTATCCRPTAARAARPSPAPASRWPMPSRGAARAAS